MSRESELTLVAVALLWLSQTVHCCTQEFQLLKHTLKAWNVEMRQKRI